MKNNLSLLSWNIKEPILLRKGARDWPAAKWTFESLYNSVGNARVPVHTGRWKVEKWRIKRDGTTNLMSAREYLNQLMLGNQKGYLAGYELLREVPSLKADLSFPNVGIFAVDVVWIGPSGTFTPIHFDFVPNIYVQLQGKKRWRLWAPSRALQPRFSGMGGFAMSKLDVGQGTEKAGIPDLDVTLEEEDILILPSRWWHRVDTLTNSIAVNRWWHFQKLGRFLGACFRRTS